MKGSKVLHMMGTIIELTVIHEDAEQVLEDLVQHLIEYEHRFSANASDSELMQINLQAGRQAVRVHPELYRLIEFGKYASLVKDTPLNIAIGPLIQTWRIGFTDARLPSETEIREKCQLIDPTNIHLNPDEQSVYLAKPGMKIDLGALAKGYITDLLVKRLVYWQVKSALLNLGGNVYVYGEQSAHLNGEWYVGIQNPFLARHQNELVIRAKNESIVTSGIYERKLTVKGHTYHHIFDTHTGYPIETPIVSVSIVAPTSLLAEKWTTQSFLTDPYQALANIEQAPGIEGVIILDNQVIHYSSGITQRIVNKS